MGLVAINDERLVCNHTHMSNDTGRTHFYGDDCDPPHANPCPCHVCGTVEEPTFEAGGVWWCQGCADYQTYLAVMEGDDADEYADADDEDENEWIVDIKTDLL